MRVKIAVILTVVFVLILLSGCVETDVGSNLKDKQILYVNVFNLGRYDSFYADGRGRTIKYIDASLYDTNSLEEYPVTVEFLGDYVKVNYYAQFTYKPTHLLVDKSNVVICYADSLNENSVPVESSQIESSFTSFPSESSKQSEVITDESQVADNSSAIEIPDNKYTLNVYDDYMTFSIPISRADAAIGLSQDVLDNEKKIAEEAKMQYTVKRTVEAYGSSVAGVSGIRTEWSQEGDNYVFTMSGESEKISEVVYKLKRNTDNTVIHFNYYVSHGTDSHGDYISVYYSPAQADNGDTSYICCSMIDHG